MASVKELVSKHRPRSTVAQIACVVGVLLLVALLGYFAVVRHESSKAASVGRDADKAEATVRTIEASTAAAGGFQKINSADLFRLTKAMPSQTDMPDVVLEMSGLAHRTGISFVSIAPQPAVTMGAYEVVPVNVTFNGTFYKLSDFIARMHHLVQVRNGKLYATGRLYSIDTFTLDESGTHFPQIQATLTLDVYTYTGDQPLAGATAVSATTPSTTGSTTPTSTSSTTTTPTPTTPATTPSTPSGASAAQGTP
jgi:Tfp pilus assembly protein PilO